MFKDPVKIKQFEHILSIPILNGNLVRFRSVDFKNELYRLNINNFLECMFYKHMILIDLNAAWGQGSNSALIKDILNTYKDSMHIRVGGGIRKLDDAAFYYDLGVDSVIISSIFMDNDHWEEGFSILEKYPQTTAALDFIPKEGQCYWLRNGWKDYLNGTVGPIPIETAYNTLDNCKNYLITNVTKVGSRKEHWAPKKFWRDEDHVIYQGGIKSVAEYDVLKRKGFSGGVLTSYVYNNYLKYELDLAHGEY